MNRPSPLLHWRGVLLLSLLGIHGQPCYSSTPGHGHETTVGESASSISASPECCESKTINYITHTLPQQCLRTSWTSPTAAVVDGQAPGNPATVGTDPEATPQDESVPPTGAAEARNTENDTLRQDMKQEQEEGSDSEELATSSFMSFEEWKEMMLRKSGQDPDSIKGQKQRERRERDPALAQADLDSIGDDGEIALDFEVLADKVSEMAAPSSGEAGGPPSNAEVREEQVLYVDGTYRSKDAGKTCKERFSFSSFDAGATILKTSPGAKSPNSILVENKDSYMLLECHTKNKFVIVELSDDILLDTVVLANYEFFSSMIRKFRVSVSARYPVKLDKWVDLGTFEARNSRDIQAFLIPHPQIYTKYIRIEFLTHYGTEYYCPVSLLRVHGTRMLDTWKEPDTNPEDDVEETIEAPPQTRDAEDERKEEVAVNNAASSTMDGEPDGQREVREVGLSPWEPGFQAALSHQTCEVNPPTASYSVSAPPDAGLYANMSASPGRLVGPSDLPKPISAEASQTHSADPGSLPPVAATSLPPSNSSAGASSGSSSSKGAGDGTATAGSPGQHQQSTARASAADSHSSSPSKASGATSTISRNKTSTTSNAAAASPTVQESFFKAVTKRLQHLESNTSLSLQYIEDQSRFLQDALQKMEKKQISRVDAFLDSLNKTVLTELRNVRIQYDQIWQSTVLALETQREQNQREIVALSSRLNVLADEVVFQKRMAILQSVLLLSCLILVIFSRGFVPAPLDLALNPQASMSAPALVSPGSPRGFFSRYRAEDSPPPSHLGPAARIRSGRHPLARSESYHDKVLPLTPTSEFSRETTPVIHVDEVEAPFYDESGQPCYANGRLPCSGNAESESLLELNRGENIADDLEYEVSRAAVLPEKVEIRDEVREESEPEPEAEPQPGPELVKPLLRHSHSTGTTTRKPLPALPEDT